MTVAHVLLLALVAALTSCAMRPNHVTFYGEHSEAETVGGSRSTRTSTNKVGASATYDFPQ